MSIKRPASVLAVAAAIAISLPAAVFAQSPVTPADRETARPISLPKRGNRPAVSKPFQRLFGGQPATPGDPLHLDDRVRDQLRFLEQGPRQLNQPRTVCGLTVWDIDPSLDPRMRLKPPQPPGVTYAITKIAPPVCQE